MSRLVALHRQSQPLYGFVYKYFEKLTPEQIPELRYDFVLTPSEVYKLAQEVLQSVENLLRTAREEDEIMDLWAHREMVLQCLVVLTNIPLMYEPLQQNNLLEEAVALRDSTLEHFSQKAVEDPEVLQAIQTGTLDQEIDKRRQADALYNSKPLFERHRSLVVNPEGVTFEEIPDSF